MEFERSHSDALAPFLHPGQTIVCGQASGEPDDLISALVRNRQRASGSRVYRGLSLSDILQPEHSDHLRFISNGAFGTNKKLHEAGVLDILPLSASAVPRLWREKKMGIDIVLIQVAADSIDGNASCGASLDYLPAALSTEAVVIAEINRAMPATHSKFTVPWSRFNAVIEVDRPLRTQGDLTPGKEELAIAALAASLIPDRSTIQVGVGRLGNQIIDALSQHKDLGFHSGVLNDAMLRIFRKGAVTGSYKTLDPGLIVVPIVLGTQEVYDFVHRNPVVSMAPVEYTNQPAVIAKQKLFTAINSALQVDLTGQVNAECIKGRYFGAVGGQADFVRGALESEGGRSIIALQSVAGDQSRIVEKLDDGVVSTPRCDADFVVTEWGIASLRGASLRERAQRMAQISHPAHRDWLVHQANANY